MTAAEFIAKIAPLAQVEQLRTSVLASITIAQGALESAWGRSAPGNNLFGIKGAGTTQDTKEYINGQWVTIKAGFRAYPDWTGSIVDHSDFLVQNGRYARAGFFQACAALDYKGAARALQQAGYATDPNYANKLISLIESNGLQKYDLVQVETEEDDMNKVLEYDQWAWDELDKYLGDAYNEGIISDWKWVQAARDKALTYKDLLLLKVLIDERRRVKA
ncbi:glycoside hydrolase family 73 protein [Paenibacillus filicis]|uniref:Glycoside hydrolase family 73 protein n=1 Tax=Paenibacillus filicis TaxID=669464 RepID=A0ABU9DID4_9BACL